MFPKIIDTQTLEMLPKMRTLFTAAIGLLFACYINQRSVVSMTLLPNGQWNCSGSDWSEFHDSFGCNLVVECAGGEDEMNCPYSGKCSLGQLTINGICYEYVQKTQKVSWLEAQLDCVQRGGYLASLNTKEEWDAVLEVMARRRRYSDTYFVGLHHTPPSLPTYYKGSYMWADETLALYVRTEKTPDGSKFRCGKLRFNSSDKIDLDSLCAKAESQNYLCELDHKSLSSVSSSEHILSSDIGVLADRTFLQYIKCAPPEQHRTLSFLACDPMARCWGNPDLIYNDLIRDVSGRPSRTSCPANMTLLPPSFRCKTGRRSVAYSLVCDSRVDCADGSDEDFCQYPPCPQTAPVRCASSGQCLPMNKWCDGQTDCHGGSDEASCEGIYQKPEVRETFIDVLLPAIVDFNSTKWRQNPHMQPSNQKLRGCPRTYFQCQRIKYCLPLYVMCNGVNDCPDNSDEVCDSSNPCKRNMYRCRGHALCILNKNMCDGVYQCPQKDDELFCPLTCPQNCTCQGLAYVCPHGLSAGEHLDIRYLDASHSGMTLQSLSHNTMLVFLSLVDCRLRHLANITLPNLHVLDVRDNMIHEITTKQLNQIPHLRMLALAENPLVSNGMFMDSMALPGLKRLVFLDLSDIKVLTITPQMFSSFAGLQYLNLSGSGVISVARAGLKSLHKLQVLDLRGCPMVQFHGDILRGLQGLQSVFADNYKLCCSVLLPEGFNGKNCHAPFDEVSSCVSLLQSSMYRILLSVFATFSLFGNLLSFLSRLIWFRRSWKSGYGVLVTHLSISDFLMGVYLAMVGVADRLYFGTYLWEDTAWRNSIACKMAGFLSLLSSEVSAFIVCVITLDRFLALRFPFSRLKFHSRSAMTVCVLIWSVCGVLATVPLLPVTEHWQLYSQTGICIPLPVTRKSFPGHNYAFGLLIVFNFVLFLLIAAGQACIFWSIRANRMTTMDTNRKSQDFKIARRLVTVAVSDFLCWFPIGLLGLLATQGVAVPGEVNVAMAIVVLPLNSALNPFLYSLNMVLERRRKVRERNLLKLIQAEGFME